MVQPAYTFDAFGLSRGISVDTGHPDHEFVVYLGSPNEEGRRAFIPVSDEAQPLISVEQKLLLEGAIANAKPDERIGRLGSLIVSSENFAAEESKLVRFNAGLPGSHHRSVQLESNYQDGDNRIATRASSYITLPTGEVIFSHHDVIEELYPGEVLFIQTHKDMPKSLDFGKPRAVMNRSGRLISMPTERLHRLTREARRARAELKHFELLGNERVIYQGKNMSAATKRKILEQTVWRDQKLKNS